jgi:DNA-directed RNA polymerase II subunit RPB2
MATCVTNGIPSLAELAPAVLNRYFESSNTFLTNHHMHSYEAYVFRELPQFIQSQNPITLLTDLLTDPKTKEKKYKYKLELYVGGLEGDKIYISAPTLQQGNTVRRLFPTDARLWNMTYAVTVSVDITVRYTILKVTGEEMVQDVEFKNNQLFVIPIMVKSRLCATYGAPSALLMEMGECRNEQGGYFIIDGSEKILVTRQEQAFNSIYVGKKVNDPQIKIYGSVVCQHPKTKVSRRVTLYILKGNANNSHLENVIRMSIPQMNGTIPLFILFRALGVETDEEIVRMIVPDPTAPGGDQIENFLHESILDAYPVMNRALAIQYIRSSIKGFIEAYVLDLLNEHVFSHIDNNIPLAKAQYLAEWVRKAIRVHLGHEEETDRDDIKNQRLLSSGMLIRGLFTNIWIEWKKNVLTALESKYKYNRDSYQEERFKDLVVAGNLRTFLQPSLENSNAADLEKDLLRGFRGKWGTSQYDMKEGVMQALGRLSFFDTLSHARRVVADFDTNMKSRGPRNLHPSQFGYFCTSEGPTGAPIGITKNLAILSTVSISANVTKVLEWLFTKGGVFPVGDTTTNMRIRMVSVQINGGTIGFVEDPVRLIRVLKFMKWTACLPPSTSISFRTGEKILCIYMDDGRPLRPVWHLGMGVGSEKWPAIVKTGKALPSWRNLLLGTFPGTAFVKGIESIAFVDPIEKKDATLEEYELFLAPYIGAIEYIDLFESNEAYISWFGPGDAQLEPEHTHAEIHPSVLSGLMVNTLPFANHNQTTRWQWASAQSKQGIGYYSTNYDKRFDTYGSIACTGQTPLVRTLYYDAVGHGEMPYGLNVIMALACVDGYNQEDAEIINRTSVERGMFHSLALRSYELTEEFDNSTKIEKKFGNPIYIKAWSDVKPGYDYSKLDERGIIREGEELTEKTVLVGMYTVDKKNAKEGVKDASITNKLFTQGRIDRVEVLMQPNGYRVVKIRVLEMRIPELGDKFATRHHQKGTMGMLMDAIDMPRTADGIVPDIIMNPHGVPTRMTVGQFYEQIYCKYGVIAGGKINATNFMDRDTTLETVGDLLEASGFERHGEEILYSGRTGAQIESSIFMGPCYLMRLKHLTEDKLNARGKGKKEMKTHQPTGGRSNEGGMRIGEMERDILIAHGTSSFLKESFMKRSDGTSVLICNGCGTIPISNPRLNLYVCPMCDGPIKFSGDTKDTLELLLPITKSRVTFSRVEIPYAYKLLEEELNTYANMYMRVITAKHARTFQPLEIVDTEAEESVEEESTEETPKETPTLMNVASEGVQAIQETLGLSSDTEEKAIAKANAVLEEAIPPPTEKKNETGTTIIIEGSGPPVPAEAAPAEAAPAEAAPAEAAPVEAAPTPAPAPVSAPASAGTEASAPSLILRPQSGGAAAEPRRRITWKGAGETVPGPDEHVTVLKIG